MFGSCIRYDKDASVLKKKIKLEKKHKDKCMRGEKIDRDR